MKTIKLSLAIGLLGVQVAIADPGVAAPAGAEAASAPCKVTFAKDLELTYSAQNVLVVRLSNPPSTRTRLSFDSDHNGHHELEWDLAVDPRLTQEVTLERDARWHVTAVVESFTIRQGNVATLVTTGAFESDEKAPGVLSASYLAAASSDAVLVPTADSKVPKPTHIAPLSLDGWPRPAFTFTCHELPTIDSTPFAPVVSVGGASQRGLSTIPAPVAEALSILGEIAVDRAKAGAMAIVKGRFVAPLCGSEFDPTAGVKLSTIGLAGGALALPRTCALLQQLRLEDVLSSGKPLLRAVRDDLRLSLAPAGIERIAGSSAWGAMVKDALGMVNRAIDRGSFSVIDAEAAIDGLKDVRVLLSTASLADATSRARLEIAIAGVLDAQAMQKRCAWTTDARACAVALIDDRTADELRTYIATLGLNSARADLADELAHIDDVAGVFGVVIGQKLADLKLPIGQLPACRHLTLPDPMRCARAIARGIWTVFDLSSVRELLQLDRKTIEGLLAKQLETRLTDQTSMAARALGVACRARLAVGVLHKCSGGACSTDDIGKMFANPADYFAKDPEFPQKLCWTGSDYRGESRDLTPYRAFVEDGLELLAAAKQSTSARMATVLRMVTRLTQEAAGCESGDRPTARCGEFEVVGEMLIAIAENDPAKALGSVTSLIKKLVPRVPPALTKGTQLLGSVAAYAEVYEDTKDRDPKAAREARTKALEGLIDAATDRHDRGGEWIVSIGSNVGLGATWTSPRAAKSASDTTDTTKDNAWAPQVRVPIGFDLDWLPSASRSGWRAGLHTGVTIGDLGQFAAVGSGGNIDTVRWDNFISPGVEVGLLLGSPQFSFNISVHAEYAPALFSDAATSSSGAFRMGFSLGYYVPFFDFN